MRVISGSMKGRRLHAVPGTNTRPTTDKIKESIFNMIGPYFDGGQVLDLFAGSGSLGIEAISRGMDHGYFIDKDSKALATIKRNLEDLRIEDQASVFRNDSKRALAALRKNETSFDLILLDPPYFKQELIALLTIIDEGKMLKEDGQIVVEHSKEVELPDEIGNLTRKRLERYGITYISIFVEGRSDSE